MTKLNRSWVGSDFKKEGLAAGEWLKAYADKQGVSAINALVISGTTGASAQIGRSDGFKEIADKYGWTILDEQTGDFTEEGGQEVMLLAGYGVTSTTELAVPLIVGILAALVMGALCGAFNGALVANLKIQPMVATLILYSAARAVGLLLCNDMIVYVRNSSYGIFGSYLGIIPTPIVITFVCIAVMSIFLRKTAMGTYIQSVGINDKASRIAGLNSTKIIFMTYLLCGIFAAVAGIVQSSRITSADSNNIGLYMQAA